MNNLREAAQQALEALEDYQSKGAPFLACDGAVDALRAALAQQAEPVEPVAWMYYLIRHDGTTHDRPSLIWRPEYMDAMSASKGAKALPLYTAPPQRKPLTQEEIDRICASLGFAAISPAEIVRAVERAHGIGETK